MLLNHSNQDHFLLEWETAIVRPLLKNKKGERIPSNYRPVSNLSYISKIVEAAAISQLQNHLQINGLFPEYQSAYRKHFSCETAVLKLHNDVLWAMEQGELYYLVCTDLSAAFDTVDHRVLLDLLKKSFGVTGVCLQWFRSYLENRQFKVSVGKEFSELKTINYSVPQGSKGGPDLFVIYSSSLQHVIDKSDNIEINAYADDHNFGKSFKPNRTGEAEKLCKEVIENTLSNIGQWMCENRLKMNPKKTEIICFGTKQQRAKLQSNTLCVIDEEITLTNVVRNLGAWFDQELKMDHHIMKKRQIALLNLYKIARIRKYLSQEAANIVVLSLVISHLDYCNSILVGVSKKYISKFQIIQNRAAKIVLNVNVRHHSIDALKQLHWLPIVARIDFKLCLLVYKCIKGFAPQYLIDLIQMDTRDRNFRHKSTSTLRVPFVSKKTCACRSFGVMGPKLWNKLPREMTFISDEDIFKKQLKTHLFNQYLNDTSDFIYY